MLTCVEPCVHYRHCCVWLWTAVRFSFGECRSTYLVLPTKPVPISLLLCHFLSNSWHCCTIVISVHGAVILLSWVSLTQGGDFSPTLPCSTTRHSWKSMVQWCLLINFRTDCICATAVYGAATWPFSLLNAVFPHQQHRCHAGAQAHSSAARGRYIGRLLRRWPSIPRSMPVQSCVTMFGPWKIYLATCLTKLYRSTIACITLERRLLFFLLLRAITTVRNAAAASYTYYIRNYTYIYK